MAIACIAVISKVAFPPSALPSARVASETVTAEMLFGCLSVAKFFDLSTKTVSPPLCSRL